MPELTKFVKLKIQCDLDLDLYVIVVIPLTSLSELSHISR